MTQDERSLITPMTTHIEGVADVSADFDHFAVQIAKHPEHLWRVLRAHPTLALALLKAAPRIAEATSRTSFDLYGGGERRASLFSATPPVHYTLANPEKFHGK